eukprot:COSAG04_NODE_527_length_13079_cov_26.785516_12_plen_96_part_00
MMPRALYDQRQPLTASSASTPSSTSIGPSNRVSQCTGSMKRGHCARSGRGSIGVRVLRYERAPCSAWAATMASFVANASSPAAAALSYIAPSKQI